MAAALAVFAVCLPVSLQAQTLNCNNSYGVAASAPGSVGQACFDKAQQFIDAFNTGGLKGLASTYTGVEQISVAGRFNDVNITSGYAALNSPTLTFVAPQLGVNQSFTGVGGSVSAQRDDAARQLSDFLKKNHYCPVNT